MHVELGKKDRHQIARMLAKGPESARVLRRALILRELDEGQTGAQVARDLGVARKTVRVIARRCMKSRAQASRGRWTQVRVRG